MCEYDKTPDGRVIANFSTSRQYELEYVAMGLHGASAHRSIKLLIGLMRSAAHLIYMATDPSIRAHYQTLGVTISSAVAAISLARSSFRQNVSWILMSAASIINGERKRFNFVVGGSTSRPGNSAYNIPMHRDYVRLIMRFSHLIPLPNVFPMSFFRHVPALYTAARTTCTGRGS